MWRQKEERERGRRGLTGKRGGRQRGDRSGRAEGWFRWDSASEASRRFRGRSCSPQPTSGAVARRRVGRFWNAPLETTADQCKSAECQGISKETQILTVCST